MEARTTSTLFVTAFLVASSLLAGIAFAEDGSRMPVTGQDAQRIVLSELFTALWCQFCPAATTAMAAVGNDTNYFPNKTAIIEWHPMSDALGISMTQTRMTQVGATGFPTPLMDIVGSPASRTESAFKATIDGRPTKAPVFIDIDTDLAGLSGNITVKATATKDLDTSFYGFEVWAVIVEDLDKPFSNSGGTGYTTWVARTVPFSQISASLSKKGDSFSKTQGFTLTNVTWNTSKMGVVAFIQGDKDKTSAQDWEVLNSGISFWTSDPETVPIADNLDFTMNEDTVDSHLDLDTVFTAPVGQSIVWIYAKGSAHINLSIGAGNIVTVTPAENWYGQETITLLGADLTSAAVSKDVKVTVSAVNDPPFVKTPLTNIKLKEGASTTIKLQTLDQEVFGDIDNPQLSYTVKSEAATSKINLSIVGGIADPAVKVQIPDGGSGKETVNVTASDGVATVSTIFDVEVTDVNHAPTVKAKMGTVTFDEDTVNTAIDLDNVFSDFDGDKLNFEFWGNTKITIAINATNVVSLTPEKDWSGTEVITFRATDIGSLNVIDELTAIVNPVNDAPVLIGQMDTIDTEEDTPFVTEDPITTYFKDVETASALLTYEVVAPTDITVTIQDDLNLQIVPADNYFGEGNFTITASDGPSAVDMVVDYEVESVNDPVVVDTANTEPISPTPAVNEGTEITFEVPAVDADGTTILYKWSVDGDVQKDATTSTFAYTPDKTMGGKKVDVSVTVSDGFGSEVTQEWTVTVKDVNNKPAVTVVSPEVGKEYPAGPVTLSSTATDIDGDALTFSWFVDGTPVGTGMNLTTDIKTAGSHTIKVKVSDGKLEDSKDVSITVKAADGGGSGGGKGSKGAPGFELVGLIAAIGVAAVVVMRRRE